MERKNICKYSKASLKNACYIVSSSGFALHSEVGLLFFFIELEAGRKSDNNESLCFAGFSKLSRGIILRRKTKTMMYVAQEKPKKKFTILFFTAMVNRRDHGGKSCIFGLW